jgi:hypothetical protein
MSQRFLDTDTVSPDGNLNTVEYKYALGCFVQKEDPGPADTIKIGGDGRVRLSSFFPKKLQRSTGHDVLPRYVKFTINPKEDTQIETQNALPNDVNDPTFNAKFSIGIPLGPFTAGALQVDIQDVSTYDPNHKGPENAYWSLPIDYVATGQKRSYGVAIDLALDPSVSPGRTINLECTSEVGYQYTVIGSGGTVYGKTKTAHVYPTFNAVQ